MKLLFHSNSPWSPTGYGSQVNLFAPDLAQQHELAISAFYGLEGARLNWNGIQVFPGLGGEYGNVCLEQHAERWFGTPRGGLVLTLLDVWVLDPEVIQKLNVASWVPVDHEPVPPAVRDYFVHSGAIPIAMTRHGQEQLSEFNALYIPHGVDLEAFKPHPKREVREKVGGDPDAFIVGMVAANKGRPSRKSFQQALDAFRIFSERHDDALLYLHTVVSANHSNGVDLPALIDALGIGDKVRVSDQYRMIFNPMPPNLMGQVFSTFDVLLNPSQGEGFGIPIVEAQACGVPVITSDHSAMRETTGAGWRVGGEPYWTGQKSWQIVPSVPQIVEALEECYSLSDDKRTRLSNRARKHAELYGRERVLREHFLPALDEIEERIGERPHLEVVA
jgi:glycosyltransferase involved in cell wall biosynthesis